MIWTPMYTLLCKLQAYPVIGLFAEFLRLSTDSGNHFMKELPHLYGIANYHSSSWKSCSVLNTAETVI